MLVQAIALVSLVAAAPGFSGSPRAAFNLAIAGTRLAPPDLTRLLVQHRRDYLQGVREAAERAPTADFAREAAALSRAILARTPMPEVVRRCGRLVGELLAAAAPPLDSEASREAFEAASRGPYRIPGVSDAAARGDPGPVARSIAIARSPFRVRADPAASASRIVADETNLLWAIWTGAGGDARPARNYEEKNGPYDVPGAPR
jgi:hypothetical protein